MQLAKPIHPFPARMAPEIALEAVDTLPSSSMVLDPMVGSGTVLRAATDHECYGFGFDVDPLAVLMTRVWTTPVDTVELCKIAQNVVFQALALKEDQTSLPWLDKDQETKAFIEFWFAKKQRNSLRKLCTIVSTKRGPIGNALRLAVSRLIVTKSRGASLAGDVSHSRPHRIRDTNDFPVFDEFLKAIDQLAQKLEKEPPSGNARINLGDARGLKELRDSYIDAIISSPPYLNAIDYLRGHRLALVWLGYTIGELRRIRIDSMGAERGLKVTIHQTLEQSLLSELRDLDLLPKDRQRMIAKYALDVFGILSEAQRVLKPGGKAIYVVGNSCLKGVYIENTKIMIAAAKRLDLRLEKQYERELPPAKRYLPPPLPNDDSLLNSRMRREAVLTFVKDGQYPSK